MQTTLADLIGEYEDLRRIAADRKRDHEVAAQDVHNAKQQILATLRQQMGVVHDGYLYLINRDGTDFTRQQIRPSHGIRVHVPPGLDDLDPPLVATQEKLAAIIAGG